MVNRVSAFIGIRYARVNKGNHFISFINRFSVLGIALGLAALIMVTSVMNGFESQLKRKILSLVPHVLVDSGVDPRQLALPPQVVAVADWLELETVVQSANGLRGVLIRGIAAHDMADNQVLTEYLEQGELASLDAGQYGIIIGRQLARDLQLSLGQKLRVIVPGKPRYTPFGPLPRQRKMTVVGIFQSGGELDSQVIYSHFNDVEKLQAKSASELGNSTYRLYLEDAFELDHVMAKLPPSLSIIENWRDRQGTLFDAVKMEKNMMTLMLLLIIAVAAFNIVSSLVMVVSEKRADVAILQTQGLNTRDIVMVFVINGMFNGFKGCFWGIVLGTVAVTQINALLFALEWYILPVENGQILPIVINPMDILSMVLLSLSFCFVATLYPAFSAAKQTPASALRYE